MQLGFVSAILPDLSLEEVVGFAAEEGFACVELMCWPKGKAERRYAGVTDRLCSPMADLSPTRSLSRSRPAASSRLVTMRCTSLATNQPTNSSRPAANRLGRKSDAGWGSRNAGASAVAARRYHR